MVELTPYGAKTLMAVMDLGLTTAAGTLAVVCLAAAVVVLMKLWDPDSFS